MSDEIKQWLILWFQNFTQKDAATISKHESDNYFELGWIDSFGFISFITEIESHFTIKFSNDEFQNKDFSTLTGLATVIKKKIHEQQ